MTKEVELVEKDTVINAKDLGHEDDSKNILDVVVTMTVDENTFKDSFGIVLKDDTLHIKKFDDMMELLSNHNDYLNKVSVSDMTEVEAKVLRSHRVVMNKISKYVSEQVIKAKKDMTSEIDGQRKELEVLFDSIIKNYKYIDDKFLENEKHNKLESLKKYYQQVLFYKESLIDTDLTFDMIFRSSWMNKTSTLANCKKEIEKILNDVEQLYTSKSLLEPFEKVEDVVRLYRDNDSNALLTLESHNNKILERQREVEELELLRQKNLELAKEKERVEKLEQERAKEVERARLAEQKLLEEKARLEQEKMILEQEKNKIEQSISQGDADLDENMVTFVVAKEDSEAVEALLKLRRINYTKK